MLMTAGFPLMKSVVTPLAKSVLLPLGLSGKMSAADAVIQKDIYGSGSTSIIWNEETENIIKIFKSFGVPRLLIKGINETIQN